MEISLQEIKDEFSNLIEDSIGDLSVKVSHRQSPGKGTLDSLIFLETEPAFNDGMTSQANAMVVNSKFAEKLKSHTDKSALITKNVPLLMSKVVEKYFGWNFHRSYGKDPIHPSAILAKTAKIGKNTVIGPNVCVGENVVIGDDGFIGANCVIEDNVTIGSQCTIHPLVYIAHSCQLGSQIIIQPNTTIGSEGYGFAHDEKGRHWRIQQTGPVILEDRVEIGSNCSIDRGAIEATRIGEGTKLDNICHIGHNVIIGKNGLITAGFAVAGSAKFGDNFACGGHTSAQGHINICDNVQVAGRSIIHNDVTEPGVYGGHPLQPVKDYLRTTMALSHLTEMRKTLSKILKKVNLG